MQPHVTHKAGATALAAPLMGIAVQLLVLCPCLAYAQTQARIALRKSL